MPEPITPEQFEEYKQQQAEVLRTLEARLDATHESLDTALEELAKGRMDTPPAAPATPETPAAPAATAKPTAEPDVDENGKFETEVEKQIKDDEAFRKEMLGLKEALETKAEAERLDLEINEALKDFPEAVKEDILIAVEAGMEEDNPNQVKLIAEKLHKNRVEYRDKIKQQVESELEQKFKTEREGNNYIPQSQGNSTANPGQANGQAPTPARVMTADEEWANAAAMAKAKFTGSGS